MLVVPGEWKWHPVFLKSDDGQQFEILREGPDEMIVKGSIKNKIKSGSSIWKPLWERTEHTASGPYQATALKRVTR